MDKIDDVKLYYMAKLESYADQIDKPEDSSLMIGIYLALVTVAKACMETTNKDAGWLYDLEKSSLVALNKAYDEELIHE